MYRRRPHNDAQPYIRAGQARSGLPLNLTFDELMTKEKHVMAENKSIDTLVTSYLIIQGHFPYYDAGQPKKLNDN
jgi:hypothetical protein